MFKFDVNNTNKVVSITVGGFFSEQEANDYIAEFQRTVRSIAPSGYTLLIDGTEQKLASQNLLEQYQGAVDLYLSANFKKTIIVLPQSAVAVMQIKKLRGSDRINFVKSLAEGKALLGRVA